MSKFRKTAFIGVVILALAFAGVSVWCALNSMHSAEIDDLPAEAVNEEAERVEIFGAFYDAAEARLREMTLEEKVGQMFLVRFAEDEAWNEIGWIEPAGYILFGQDFRYETPETLSEKLQNYQQVSKFGLIFGVDEEGGTVVRMSRYSAFREEPFKSPQELWDAGGMAAILADATEKSQRLKSLGINMNLTPVADVSLNPEDFIYKRALGKSATETAEYVAAVVERMNEDGMISVMKHFPGYGDNTDTHTGAVIDERSYDKFLMEDFLPFQAGISAGGPSILVSHNIVAALDPEKPASLSPVVIDVLRSELGFSGVVMTDDLKMDAVSEYNSEGRAAALAVLAGNDLIITSSFAKHRQEVTMAVQNGEIDEGVIDLAVRRVLAMKYKYGVVK